VENWQAYLLIRRIVVEIMIPPLITIRRTGTQTYSEYSIFSRATEMPAKPNKKTRNIKKITMEHIISESYQGTYTFLNSGF